MDDAEDEKKRLLESIRIQDEALSERFDSETQIITCDSDAESDQDTCSDKLGDGNIQTAPDLDQEDKDPPIPYSESTVAEGDELDVEPSYSNALSSNREYDEALEKVEQEIRQNIARIDKRLAELDREIGKVSDKRTASTNTKSNWLYMFGAPYFKDADFYPCPSNQDYFSKKKNNELCWYDLPVFHQWTNDHKKKLTKAIYELSRKVCETEAKKKVAEWQRELERLKTSGDTTSYEILDQQIKSFDISKAVEDNLEDYVLNGEHDWMTVSAKYLEGRHAPEGCRSFWNMYLHPSINKESWSHAEEKALNQLAIKYSFEDWDKIAKELGTNRSGYQCFILYQTKLNANLKRNLWSPHEDKRLKEVIERCRLGDYIPWGKVAFYMDGRTKAQVFNRWTYSLNPVIKKGRFTKQEDILILVGVSMWGEDFTRIANFMQDRTTCQVRDRYRNYLKKADLGIPWTVADDELLLSLKRKHGNNYSDISKHFPGKDRTQVRHRFNTLKKWQEKFPGLPLTDAPCRKNMKNTKDFEELWARARSILNCETVEELVQAKEEIVAACSKERLPKIKPKPRKVEKRQTLVENDLLNYLRCSYPVPGGRRKTILRVNESVKCARQLKGFLDVLNAKLTIPADEVLEADSSLSHVDKEILKTYMLLPNIETVKESPPSSPDSVITPGIFDDDDTSETEESIFHSGVSLPSTSKDMCFSDRPSTFTPPARPSTPPGIDYVSSNTTLSTFIELPLMNFSQDEVVVDQPKHSNLVKDSVCSVQPTGSDNYEEHRKCADDLYVCPPNFTTMVGLRTYLLNRRTLCDITSSTPARPLFVDVGNNRPIPGFAEARKAFDRRLLSLFLWPALMSRESPSDEGIFEDISDKECKSAREKYGFLVPDPREPRKTRKRPPQIRKQVRKTDDIATVYKIRTRTVASDLGDEDVMDCDPSPENNSIDQVDGDTAYEQDCIQSSSDTGDGGQMDCDPLPESDPIADLESEDVPIIDLETKIELDDDDGNPVFV